jgi:hypothetical protein
MSEELDVLQLVCQKLEQANVPYMLTGSFAANFYAVPRMTRDIDIVIEIDKPSDASILTHLFQNEFYIDKASIIEAMKTHGMFNIIHNGSVVKIDFIVRKDTPYRHIEFQRKNRVIFDGTPLWIVTPEDLIISKLFWAKDSLSEMQIRDIRNLLKSVKNLNTDYINEWVRTLNLDQLFERVLSNE